MTPNWSGNSSSIAHGRPLSWRPNSTRNRSWLPASSDSLMRSDAHYRVGLRRISPLIDVLRGPGPDEEDLIGATTSCARLATKLAEKLPGETPHGALGLSS